MVRLLALLSMLTACGRLGFDLFGNGNPSDPDAARDGEIGDGSADASFDAPPVGGPLVQQTPMFNGVGPATLTLPAPSTAGTLLVITLSANDTSSLVLPTGFTIATQVNVNGGGFALLAYRANNPGGITSVSYTMNSGAPSVTQLTEWMGVVATSPVDVFGVSAGMNPTTAQTVSTGQTTTAPNDLAITVFNEDVSTPSYTSEPGWLRLGTASNTSALPSYLADYKPNVPLGSIGEAVTSSVGGKYAALIVTFRTQ